MRLQLESEHFKRQMVLVLVFLFVFLLSIITEMVHRQIAFPSLGEGIFTAFRQFLLSVFSLIPAAVLNVLPALAAMVIIPWLASRFIHDLHDTQDISEAHQFLDRNVFGMKTLKPVLIVKEGKIGVGAGSLSDLLGGRAFLIVYSDSAAVLEKGGELTRVVGPSVSFLDRFERVWEVVDLRRQHWPINVSAMTKDGLPVSCEANITFKVDDRYIDRWGNERTKPPLENPELPIPTADLDQNIVKQLGKGGISKPYPYTDDAVLKAATCEWIRIRQEDHPEQLRRWTGRVVIGAVEGTLRSILADYRLDWLIRPVPSDRDHPREEIRDRLEKALRGKFPIDNALGARILDVSLGRVDVKNDKISQQWVEAWQAGWEQRTAEIQAEGEAKQVYTEAAHVQAQAEIALALTEAIRPLIINGQEISSYKLATRFVETLWWLSYSPGTRDMMPSEATRLLTKLQDQLDDNSEES